MVRYLIILIVSIVVSGESKCQILNGDIARIPITKYFEPSDYNGGIQNWSFAQDSSGVLYVANNFGLLGFNGSSWQNYYVPNTTKIRSVHIDKKDDRIYIGGQGQIGYFEKKTHGLVFISLLERLPIEEREIGEVWKIVDYRNKLFFNTSNKLFVLEGSKFESIKLPGKLNRVFSLDSTLIVQFDFGGLHRYENEQFIPIPGTSILTDEVISVLDYKEGFICLTTTGKTYIHNGNDLTPFISGISRSLRSTTVNTCLRLSTGDIAIGTQNKGLYIVNERMELIRHFSRGRGLHNRTVLTIHEDDFKNLWVGLNNGINYLELNSPLSLINEQVGLEGTGYTAAFDKGAVYLGTNNGLFRQKITLEDNILSQYELIPGTEGQVYKLSRIQNELILSHHRGAFQVYGEKISQFHSAGSWKFLPTTKDNLFICGDYNGIKFFKVNNGVWNLAGQVDGLAESSRVLEFENDSTLWMTHGYKGAYRISLDPTLTKANEVKFYGAENGFPSNILISVYKLDNNLVFTAENGIYDFDGQSQQFNENQFLMELIGDEHVSNITTTIGGDIFFLSNRELGHLKRESFGTYIKEQNVFKRINKFLSDDLENITILDDKNVLIGAKEGFIHFDPTQSYKLVEEFNVLLNKVELQFPDDSTTTILGGFLNNIEIEKNSSLRLEFSSPYFDGFEDLVYSYRLIGFDNNWSDWSSLAVKEYTNLPAGDFTFEVKAKNIYGSESEISASFFRIIPHWYRSNFAYVSYVFAAIVLFGFISFLQDKKYRKEKEILHQSKEEAIKSKDEELSNVSRQSKEEIENLRNEKLKSEIDYKNNELASTTMHLLNKNEFVNGVKKRIETIVQENGSSKEELKKIIKTIDRNLQEDDSWDQFAYHFDQVHGDFLKNISTDEVKLTPQETKLAAYLRMNMSSKEIANLMNISVRGVELARYRLRKKLGLERDQNLIEYLLNV